MSGPFLFYMILGLFFGLGYLGYLLETSYEENRIPKILRISLWFKHIRECDTLKSLGDSTKVKLGYLSFIGYILMLFVVWTLWGIILSRKLYLTINDVMKEAVGVSDE